MRTTIILIIALFNVMTVNSQTRMLPSNSSGSSSNNQKSDQGEIKQVVRTVDCSGCYGNIVCRACYGRGGSSIGYGADAIWYNCALCGGKGVCNKCKGKGKATIITFFDSNGSIIATYDESIGKIIYADNNSTVPSSNRNRNTGSAQLCRVCDGIGWIKRAIPAIRVNGEECPRCHEWMASGTCGHIHQVCSACSGRGTDK